MITIRKHLKLKYSLLWLKQGFITFREKPLQFIILQLIAYTLTLLPFLGPFLAPLFMSRFAFCANKIEKHERLLLKDVFKDLFSNGLVLRLAFINFCLSTVLLLLGQYLLKIEYTDPNILLSSLFLILLASSILILSMSMWLSPALCLFNDNIEPKSAMWLSIKVCFYNILLFFAFSIIVGGITLAIGIPLFLLMFKVWDNAYLVTPVFIIVYIISNLWFTILNITSYYVYKMVFQKTDSSNA